MRIIAFLLLLPVLTQYINAQENEALKPVLEGEFWRVGTSPDLDSLNGKDLSRQHVVDHGFIRDEAGTWHLWACMRGTKVGRLLYGWEGGSLTAGPWKEAGIVARAQSSWGERTSGEEKMQAPYFKKIGDTYYCFYNSNGIQVMLSEDGSHYKREKINGTDNVLYQKGGRDVMVLEDEGIYFAYSTVSTVAKDDWLSGFVIVRTSPDLKKWSDYTIVSQGGRAGNGAVSAESPFVQKYRGYYYLFRSSSSTGTTFVYRSDDPYYFGVNDDSRLVTELPVWAPEILYDAGQWYISDIADFKGIKISKFDWK